MDLPVTSTSCSLCSRLCKCTGTASGICRGMHILWCIMHALLDSLPTHGSDVDCVHCRYQQLASANEHLAGQLKEAHEALYEVQTAVQATPVHKRHQQQHLMARLRGAEEVGHASAVC